MKRFYKSFPLNADKINKDFVTVIPREVLAVDVVMTEKRKRDSMWYKQINIINIKTKPPNFVKIMQLNPSNIPTIPRGQH